MIQFIFENFIRNLPVERFFFILKGQFQVSVYKSCLWGEKILCLFGVF